jgi:undecaprenyl pyrophosphate phosphatase UppP
LIAGLFAIKALFAALERNLFFIFGIYCMLIGAAAVILSK